MNTDNQPYHSAEMQVLLHHIYEYNKGLRNLVLHTMNIEERMKAEQSLQRREIHYFIQEVNSSKINIFFGKEECVKIIKSFGHTSLTHFTDEQDFMLGVMLGYDRMQQCERYTRRKKVCESLKSA